MNALTKKIGILSLSVLFTLGMAMVAEAHPMEHGGGEHHMQGGEHHMQGGEHHHYENHNNQHRDYHPNEHPGGYGNYHSPAVIDEQGGNGTVVVPVNDGNNNDNGNDDPMGQNPQTQGGQIFDMYNQNNR